MYGISTQLFIIVYITLYHMCIYVPIVPICHNVVLEIFLFFFNTYSILLYKINAI